MKPYYADDAVKIYHGDCREILPEISGVRLVVTDPPYVFGIASTANEGKCGGWGDLMNSACWYAVILKHLQRIVSARSGAAWIFNSWRSFPVLARASFEAEWGINSLMVWDKEWIATGHPAGLRSSYELVALFAAQGFGIEDRSLPDVWRCPWSSHKPNGHPAEKPVELLRRIIHASGGGVVLDPFAGSGSTLVAAKALGHPSIGIEIEERYCEIAARRMGQEVLPLVHATESRP